MTHGVQKCTFFVHPIPMMTCNKVSANPRRGGGHCIVKFNTMCGQKNLLLVSCIIKMGQNFINWFSWLDIHDIYYIVKNGNQIWRLKKKNTLCLSRVAQNWIRIITTKMTNFFRKYTKDIINGCVFVEKTS